MLHVAGSGGHYKVSVLQLGKCLKTVRARGLRHLLDVVDGLRLEYHTKVVTEPRNAGLGFATHGCHRGLNARLP